MLTLFHAPYSRSTRILGLIEELGIRDQVRVEVVSIKRGDGSGAPDPRNPHPEAKVPLLVDDGVAIRESVAILQYLAEKFPQAGLEVPAGHPLRGPYLAWFAWYAGVFEPLIDFHLMGLDDPRLAYPFRTLAEAQALIARTLEAGPWMVGGSYTAVDLLMASVFNWQPSLMPDTAAVRDWLGRCNARPASARAMEREAQFAATA